MGEGGREEASPPRGRVWGEGFVGLLGLGLFMRSEKGVVGDGGCVLGGGQGMNMCEKWSREMEDVWAE